MTYFESLLENSLGSTDSDIPSLGSLKKKSSSPFPPETEVKYYTANLSDAGDRATLEMILTKSLRCQGVLTTPGDIVVVTESGTFDKDGCYNVMVKYLEYCAVEAQKDA